MTSLVHSIRRRSLVLSLALTSFAAAGGALASIASGSDYAAPDVLQLGYGPGGPPSAEASLVREPAQAGSGSAYGSAEIIQLGYGPGGPPASGRS
jgi:hypothetical protein